MYIFTLFGVKNFVETTYMYEKLVVYLANEVLKMDTTGVYMYTVFAVIVLDIYL